MINLDWSNAGLRNFWDLYGDVAILITGAALAVALAYLIRKMFKGGHASKRVATVAAVLTMAWTAEGVIQTAISDWMIPVAFAVPAFAVFESLQLASALKAEENRKAIGAPGPAGYFTFVIAIVQGTAAASGADVFGLAWFRIALPLLGVGVWFLMLVAERDDDNPEWKEVRAKRKADREASWVWTPTTVLVRLGLKRPGAITQSAAEREAKVARMVELADVVTMLSPLAAADAISHIQRRKLDRARTKLRELTRAADADMVAEVAARVDRANRAEQLMVPSSTEPPVEKWARPPKPPTVDGPPADDEDEDDEVPSSPAPNGVEARPREVPDEDFNRHASRIAFVQQHLSDTWWNGKRSPSVKNIQALAKVAGGEGLGLGNQANAQAVAACLRILRWDRLFSGVNTEPK